MDDVVSRILGSALDRVPVDALCLSERNPRRGDVCAIRESLISNGQYRPLIVNRPTMEVLVGNHTLRAIRELGWEEAAVQFVEVDEEHARRILLVDNRTSDLAGYDERELAALLCELPSLEGTGWDEVALGELLDGLAADVPVEDDEVPPVPAEPVTRPGELLILGAHRLVCGDARDPAVVDRLMAGELASLLWTDPPFGVEYVGKTDARLRLQGDTKDGLEELLSEVFTNTDRVLVAGAPLYVVHPAGPLAIVFLRAFSDVGWQHRQSLAWVKDQFVFGRTDYHYQHEPLLFGYRPGAGRLGRGGEGWFGGNRQSSVFEVPRPRSSREHPTAKPPELVAIAVRNSSQRGAVVLDPFAGSGSTMVACERLGRAARLVEIDPAYCDVVVERFERLTGQQVIREPMEE